MKELIEELRNHSAARTGYTTELLMRACDAIESQAATIALYETTAENYELLQAKVDEQAREIERLKERVSTRNINLANATSELAALKAQPSGLALPNEAHLWPLDIGVEAQQRAADAGCDRIDCLHDGLQAMLSEVARLNSSPVSAGQAQLTEETSRPECTCPNFRDAGKPGALPHP